jgi:hypothetical protein
MFLGGHVFHNICLDSWLKKSHSCPKCRQLIFNDRYYIGQLHLERLPFHNPLLKNLLDLAIVLNNKLQQKEEELRNAENHNKELEKQLIKAKMEIKPEIKEEKLSCEEVPLNSSCVIQPRRNIVRTASRPTRSEFSWIFIICF